MNIQSPFLHLRRAHSTFLRCIIYFACFFPSCRGDNKTTKQSYLTTFLIVLSRKTFQKFLCL